MKLRLVGLAALAFAIACEPTKEPSALTAPSGPSEIILDGAHGGNKDFFFLPPMVPLPIGNPDFELGKFNNTLRPALKVEICELKAQNLNAQGLPTEATGCVAGAPLKNFAPGSVQLVNLPVRQNGWWTLFNLPPDGFYYVLWDTRQSNLNVNKYYRIKVLIDGSTTPLGVADVDPMANLFQWKYTNTGQVIQLVDDVLLPIPFRVEKGGGSTLCGSSKLCVSTTVTNNNPAGFQTVTVEGGAGAIAGAKFPNGWLPANGPQNVVVTIASVDLGGTNEGNGTSLKPCHVGLPLQQFPGCFNFSTTPRLAFIGDTDHQFAAAVTVAVCYSLQNSGDPREKFAEMYSSGPNEPPHALADVSDAGILSPSARNCNTTPVIGSAPSKGVSGFASASWRRIKTGVSSVFGVKTAYGVDLGLGGFSFAFSNIGPALAASMQAVGSTDITLPGGGNYQPFVRLVGSNHHDGEHQNTVGLAGLTVQFQVAAANGTLAQLGSEAGGATQLSVVTNDLPIDIENPVSGGGYAAVNWSVPTTPGTYHITATGPALNGPVTFAVTVVPTIAQLRAQAFDDFGVAYRGNNNGGGTPGVSEGQVTFSALLSDEFTNAETFPTRIEIDRRSIQIDNVSSQAVFRDLQQARASLDYAIAQTALAPGASAPPTPVDLMIDWGFANILVAENYCSGVPVSQLNAAGVMVYGPQQTTQQVLQAAVAKFDTVIVMTTGNPNLAPARNVANIGKARALLALGDYAGAGAAGAQVPNGGTLSVGANAEIARQNNGVYQLQNVQRRWTVSDNEGGNGLPYRSDADPRVPFSNVGLGFDNQTQVFGQQKYPSLGALTVLAPSAEARLIGAEVSLRQGDLVNMTATLNALRAAAGLPPLLAPASQAEAIQILFKERAYTLWLTSHRLGDMRRLIRDYGFVQNQLFPTGEYFKGGNYGADVNFPIPVDAQFNPTGMACFNRSP